MAKISRWTVFLRAFLITLLVGQATRVGSADQNEESAWETARSFGTSAAFYAYLREYPAGEYVEQAINSLIKLGALENSESTRSVPSLSNGGSSGSAAASLY